MNVIEIKEGWLEKGWTEAQNHPFTTSDHCFSADEGGPPKKCNFIEVNQTGWGRSGMIRLLLQTTWRPFMSKQTDQIQGGQKRNWCQGDINLLLESYQGLSSFQDYLAYTFQHHHPLIRSFFPVKTLLEGLNYVISLQNILFNISKFVNSIWLIKFSK